MVACTLWPAEEIPIDLQISATHADRNPQSYDIDTSENNRSEACSSGYEALGSSCPNIQSDFEATPNGRVPPNVPAQTKPASKEKEDISYEINIAREGDPDRRPKADS